MKKAILVSVLMLVLSILSACGGGNGGGNHQLAAAHFSVMAQGNAVAGTAFQITVTALDASNNTVTTYSGTVHFTSTDGQAALPPNSSLTNGTKNFSVTLKTAGSQTITTTDTVTASITGTSSAIAVGGSAASHFSVVAPASASQGAAFNITVTAFDTSNNVVATYSGTVHFTSTDGQAILPPNSKLTKGVGIFSATLKTTGNQTITATDTVTTSITGTSIPINVSGPPATHLSVTAPKIATVGTAINVAVTALDAANNVATSYSGTVHFTSSDGQAELPADSMLTNGTAMFPAVLKSVGSQTITATDTVTASIKGTSNSIKVGVATAANPVPLINQPLVPSAAIPGGAAFKLKVNGTGFVSGAVVRWNGSSRGTTFVTGSELTASILATDIASFNTASVTVVNPAPGGAASNVVFFETTRPTSSVALGISSQLALGSGPFSVTTGDFNGDGKLDLAMANGDNAVIVLLGNGDGTFQPAASYSVGTVPNFVAVGDFNGDGKADLVVANVGSDNVSILLGNGDGTFLPAINYSTDSHPGWIALGDFNGDGKLDLAVANSFSSDISVLLGNGDGTFEAALNYVTGFSPLSIAVGDFDGDDKLDLAVVNFGATVSILHGNGDGTFQPGVTYSAGAVPVSVAVGDFNGDGKLDLAVANIGVGNAGPSSVSILLGKGDGTFQPPVDYNSGSDTSQSYLTLGDFNGDGILDLAVANLGNSASGSEVSVLLGNGDGTFQTSVEYNAGANPLSIVVGDFNRDGRMDMAVANGVSSTVSIVLQPSLVSGPNAVLTPHNLTFPTQLLGTTSSAQSVLLSNYGTAPVNITNVTTTGDFNETESCGSSLAPGASCTIEVSFTPSTSGNLDGTLSITDDAPGSPQTISTSGTGTAVKLSSTNLRFSCLEQNLGPQGFKCICTREAQETLTNVGKNALGITGITTSGPFSQTNSCPSSLGAGQSCTITVDWSHTTGGGVLSISDNGGGSPQTVSLFGFAQCQPSKNSSSVSAAGSATCF